MRKGRLDLLLGIAACTVCVLALLCWIFRSEILTFLMSLKTYGIVLVPVFFIIGVYFFQSNKWSVSSILSLWCLIFLVIGSWLAIVTMFSGTPSGPDVPDAGARIKAYVGWIFAAEAGLLIIMITSAIASYRQNKRISDCSNKKCKNDETDYPLD